MTSRSDAKSGRTAGKARAHNHGEPAGIEGWRGRWHDVLTRIRHRLERDDSGAS